MSVDNVLKAQIVMARSSSVSRPRRSTAKKIDYHALFNDANGLDSSPSSSSSDTDAPSDGETANGRTASKGKGKGVEGRASSKSRGPGRRRNPSPELSDDESAFDPEEEQPTSEEDDYSDGEGHSIEDSSRVSTEDLDGSDSTPLDRQHVLRKGEQGRFGSRKRAAPSLKAPTLNTSGYRLQGVSDEQWTRTQAGGSGKLLPDQVPSSLGTGPLQRSSNSKHLPHAFRAYGPLWNPPEFVALGKAGYGPTSSEHDSQSHFRRGGRASEGVRRLACRLHELELFGPSAELVEDLGWWKEKWREGNDPAERSSQAANMDGTPQGTGCEEDVWGGWYPNIRIRKSNISKLCVEAERTLYLPGFSPLRAGTVPADSSPEDNAPGMALKCKIGSVTEGEPRTSEVRPEQNEHRFRLLEAYRLDSFSQRKPGHLLISGGRPVSLDFLPLTPGVGSVEASARRPNEEPRDYLAVGVASTDPGSGKIPSSSDSARRVLGSVQLWSGPAFADHENSRTTNHTPPELGAPVPQWKLDFVIALQATPTVIKWCPRGGKKPTRAAENLPGDELATLGILAVGTTDGFVSFYAVPYPAEVPGSEPLMEAPVIVLPPKARLHLRGPFCCALDWGAHDLVACGLSNGFLAILRPASALHGQTKLSRPSVYVPVHRGPVRGVAWVRAPPRQPMRGDVLLKADPVFLMTSGADGSGCLLDTREPHASMLLFRARGAASAAAFSTHSGTVIVSDSDNHVRSTILRPRDVGMLKRVMHCTGPVSGIATSDLHPFVAIATASGSCLIGSCDRPWQRPRGTDLYETHVYRIDLDRESQELRILDNIMPEAVRQDLRPNTKKRATSKVGPQKPDPTSVWPPIVGVLSVAWNPSIRRSALLASGAACGIVRLDWVEGARARPSLGWDELDRLRQEAETSIQVGGEADS